LKFFQLEKKELEHISTLDWDSMLNYLEKKYGIKYKNEFKKRLIEKFEKLKEQYKNELEK